MITKNVRFEYYEVVYRNKSDKKNDRDRLFDLVKWIGKTGELALEERTYSYYNELARLEIAYYDTDLEYYFLHFVRLRDNVPSIAKLKGKVEPIDLDDDEYIGEEVSALYDERFNILMLQRNRHSLGPSGIELYLNRAWDNEDQEIFLRPICPKDMFEVAGRAGVYRKLHLKFADVNPEHYDGEKKSPLFDILNNFGKYHGLQGEVVISLGRTKDISLDEKAVHDTLDDIKQNKDKKLIKKAELHLKESDDTMVEVVDLFAQKAHDFGQFSIEKKTTLSHYAVADKMWTIYHKGKRRYAIREYLDRE